MKKYLAAALILVGLFAGGLVNGRCADRLAARIIERAESVSGLAGEGKFEKAAAAAAETARLWKAADAYTSVFVRHAESDAVSDAVSDMCAALDAGDAAAARSAVNRLQGHLREIARMEHIRFGTVF